VLQFLTYFPLIAMLSASAPSADSYDGVAIDLHLRAHTAQQRDWMSRMRAVAASTALAFSVVLLLAVSTTQSAQAQTFTTLASFDGTNGSASYAPLVQASIGKLYGTTNQGGSYGEGTVFEITPSGTLKALYSFCAQSGCPDGEDLVAGLIEDSNGILYGTTEHGGPNSWGTVFKITLAGALTTLDSFGVANGCASDPESPLVQATNGVLYGTTNCGGINGAGSVFSVTTGGSLNTTYSFCAGPSCGDPPINGDNNGFAPQAGLIQATDGNLYGTTVSGGVNAATSPNGGGTVFKITPNGGLTTLYSFCSLSNCTDGWGPVAGLVQGTDGNFYGTTVYNGYDSAGTVFKITPSGELTTLYTFCSQSDCADGSGPSAPLIQATDGNFYGTTSYGGNTSGGTATGWGTIFQITPSGILTTLYTFCSESTSESPCADGGRSFAALVQVTDGNFYGTTSTYGTDSSCYCGTVFSLSVGLGAFVKTLPTSGKAETAVKILGTDLTGATSVTFNGTAAAFTVVSSSEITTSVPAGATSGSVTVMTPGSTLISNVPFLIAGSPTSTSVTSSRNPSAFGQSVTFTATVSASSVTPAGTVTFKNGSVTLGTATLVGGVATLTTTTLSAGTHSITAVYNGVPDFSSSTSSALSQVVNPATSTVTLTSSLNPSTLGQSVTFTATVAPEFSGTPKGTVKFKNRNATLGSATLTDDVATLTTTALGVGTHSITAVYDGNASFSGSTSSVLAQVVNPAP
jgi:uncharacterized repeat protein (TIGR03803 family)